MLICAGLPLCQHMLAISGHAEFAAGVAPTLRPWVAMSGRSGAAGSLEQADAPQDAEGGNDGVGRTCVRAIRTGKCHLQVCLKLLGILYQGDEDIGTSSWVGGTVGDDLYLAMVMLNSSLLKALHVVDSFHMHCRRELPKTLEEESLTCAVGQLGANFPECRTCGAGKLARMPKRGVAHNLPGFSLTELGDVLQEVPPVLSMWRTRILQPRKDAARLPSLWATSARGRQLRPCRI